MNADFGHEAYSPLIPPRTRVHRVRGVDYHVSEWGDPADPLIVLLHGWGDCGATFQLVVDALRRSWFVAAPDWRGFGRTASPSPAFWFPDYLADLDALLAVYSPDTPAALVGHSMGGNVAGLYAGSLPERVRAFVNVEGFGLPDADPEGAPGNYRRWIEEGRRPRPYRVYRAWDELAERIRTHNPRMAPAHADFAARQWGVPGDDGGIRLRADPAHRLPNAVLYRRAEAAACWSRITARVLRVRGAESGIGAAAEGWPDAGGRGWPLETIPGAGHRVHFEQPGRLAAVIEAFL